MKFLKTYTTSIVLFAFLALIAILYLVVPKQTFSETEKRVLSDFPKAELNLIADGSFGEALETYLADHFPMRKEFVGLDAYYKLLIGQNGASGIYHCKDGYLIAAPERFDETRARNNIHRLAEFAESVSLPAAIMTVPMAGYVMQDRFTAPHAPYFDEDLQKVIAENKGSLQTIDLDFRSIADQPLYYRTDHHLTSHGAYQMYLQFCKAMNIEPKEFTLSEESEGFYGTGYSKSGLWLTEPDTLQILRCNDPSVFTVTIHEGEEKTSNNLYFESHLSELDQYPVFLDGNHSLVTIDNQSNQNGKRLLLIKDSYAHCFATFAAEHYEHICMVDLRYFKGSVTNLIAEYNLNEILYLYGTENLAASTDIAWLN